LLIWELCGENIADSYPRQAEPNYPIFEQISSTGVFLSASLEQYRIEI